MIVYWKSYQKKEEIIEREIIIIKMNCWII